MPVRRIKPKNVPQKQSPASSNHAKAKPVHSSTDQESAPPTGAKKLKDYDVGYKKPPKSGQFKKGQSGNPNGRPKGAKSPKSIVLSLLSKRIPVKTHNGEQNMSKMEALFHKQVEKASRGDDKAFKVLLNLYGEALADKLAADAALGKEETITASDRAILDLFLQQNETNGSAGGKDADQ